MLPSPVTNTSAAQPQQQETVRSTPLDYVVYQVVTVGAILLVLGTIWVF